MRLFRSGLWARLLNAGLGIWLMAAPAALGYGSPAADADRLVGPIAASCAVIAIWETTRALRHVNTSLGLWLLIAPLALGHPLGAAVNSVLVGLAMAWFSRIGGEVAGQYGGGWRALRGPAT
jgi:hypothetical protein